MPFSLGSFLTAAGSAAAGGLQGDRDRRQREEEQRRYEEQRQRQAMQDQFNQRLLEARLADYRQQAEERKTRAQQEAEDRDRALSEQIRGEALTSERAQMYHDLYPNQVAQGMNPQLAVERGQAAEKQAELDAANRRRLEQITTAAAVKPQPGPKISVDPAVASSVTNTVQKMNALLAEDQTAAYLPATAAVAQALSRIRLLGISPGSALAGVGLTDNQRKFQQLSWEFSHNYTAGLPKSRATPTFTNMIHDTFFPAGPAQSNPEQVQNYRDEWTRVAARFARAARGEAVDWSGLPGFEETAGQMDMIGQAVQPQGNPFAGFNWNEP